MKNVKLFLDHESQEPMRIGLLRTSGHPEPHELFFHINRWNEGLNFKRKTDLQKEGVFHTYKHLCFKTYCEDLKCYFQIFSNKSIEAVIKPLQGDLFSSETNINYLLPFDKDVDYILKTSDNIINFSVFSHVENILFPIQEVSLDSGEELYNIIQYHE